MNRHLATLTGAAAWLAASAACAMAAPPAAPAVSTQTASTVDGLYPIAGLRDPFVPVPGGSGRGGAAAAPTDAEGSAMPAGLMPPEEFSIHALALKGVMEDRSGALAVLVDSKYGASFVLKQGRLYDVKNKPVPGVTGVVKVKQKTVRLTTPERDVEVLRMGEHEDNDSGGAYGAQPPPRDKR
ncbi:MAG: hypothetical protein NTX64_10760 [Elusimicrobia bacterium]|nr:hypothetical protein [Elusimicrobiota bacterium]